MKLNKKGFMLAEVVIVASIVSTVLISIYISLSRISNAYDTRNKYYDIDAMYASMEINKKIDSAYDSIEYYTLINNDYITFYNDKSQNTIVSYYVKSNISSLETLNYNTNNKYLIEYINYLEDNIIFDNYRYLIIVELIEKNNQDNHHFYTLKVGDNNES